MTQLIELAKKKKFTVAVYPIRDNDWIDIGQLSNYTNIRERLDKENKLDNATKQKILLVVYDNGSYDHVFPMGFGALAAVLKRDGHEIVVWSQDMHH